MCVWHTHTNIRADFVRFLCKVAFYTLSFTFQHVFCTIPFYLQKEWILWANVVFMYRKRRNGRKLSSADSVQVCCCQGLLKVIAVYWVGEIVVWACFPNIRLFIYKKIYVSFCVSTFVKVSFLLLSPSCSFNISMC